MKLKKYISGLFAAAALCSVAFSTGCNTDDPEKFATALNDTLISADGGMGTLKVFTPGEFNWSVDFGNIEMQDAEGPWWLTIDPMSGKGDVAVHFTALPTPCYSERGATFAVNCGDFSHAYHIRQAGTGDFGFSSSEVSFYTSSSIWAYGVYSWIVDSKPEWLTVSPTSGTAPGAPSEGGQDIELSALPSTNERSGFLVFKDQNGKLYTIEVVQLSSIL